MKVLAISSFLVSLLVPVQGGGSERVSRWVGVCGRSTFYSAVLEGFSDLRLGFVYLSLNFCLWSENSCGVAVLVLIFRLWFAVGFCCCVKIDQ